MKRYLYLLVVFIFSLARVWMLVYLGSQILAQYLDWLPWLLTIFRTGEIEASFTAILVVIAFTSFTSLFLMAVWWIAGLGMAHSALMWKLLKLPYLPFDEV